MIAFEQRHDGYGPCGPMEYSLMGSHAQGGGSLAHDQYAVQPDDALDPHSISTGQDDDHAMDDMFDFLGYQGEDHTEQIPFYTQQEPDTFYQHQDESMEAGQSAEVIDDEPEDALQTLFESALASYYFDQPLKSLAIPMLPSNFAEELIDPPGSVDVAEIATFTNAEKWDVDKSTMEFLACVMSLSAPVLSFSERCGLRPRFRDVKLEEPVLRTDAATDMRLLQERNIIRLTSKGFKPLPVDKRHDQELQWSSKSLRLPDDVDKLLANEKMTVSSETGNFLKEVFEDMKDDPTASLYKERLQKATIRPMTPPLLPLSPPYSPGRLPSPAAQLPFTSTPEDPLIREAVELEAQIMNDDDNEETDANIIEPTTMYSPLHTSANSSSSPLRRKMSKISDLKMSSPLFPLGSNEPPTKKLKTVSFAEEIQDMGPLRESEDSSTDIIIAVDEALAAVSALSEPLARTALEKANHEQLIEIDTTARVTVPTIEDIEPKAPWEAYLGRHRALLQDSRAEISKAEKKWSGASSLERLLPWSPFPAHLGKPKPERDFDDGSFARYLAELDIEGKVNLQLMAWKPDGLRLLDVDECDEEELQALNYEPCDGKSYQEQLVQQAQVVQVANMTIREPVTSLHFRPEQPTQPNNGQPPAATVDPQVPTRAPADTVRMISQRDVEPEVNSMQALLQNRKKHLQREKAILAASLASKTHGTLDENAAQTSKGEPREAAINHGTLSAFLAVQGIHENARTKVSKAIQPEASGVTKRQEPLIMPSKPKLDVPAPQVTISDSRLPIVVSTSVLANRQLTRKLKQQLPALDIIERDSTSINGASVQGIIPSREADFTLSPSTGLVFTTLQKLKQRPLPGQEASFTGIREQIARVAIRYERLIVLLSEGSHSPSEAQTHIRTLDGRDSGAIADFIGSFARLDTDVQVSYIPGGDDELVRWIAAAAIHHAPCIEDFRLFDLETVWERFLRKAGLNVFAAQVVLDQLKPPDNESGSDSSPTQQHAVIPIDFECYGLAAFVRMGVEERVQRFGPLIGGEKLLRRVSMVVDGSWRVLAKRR